MKVMDKTNRNVTSLAISGAILGTIFGAISCPAWGLIDGWLILMMMGSGFLAPIMIVIFGGTLGAIFGAIVGAIAGKKIEL